MRSKGPAGTRAAVWADPPPTVLVVDDDPDVLAVVRAGLRRHGFEVVATDDGREAIERFHDLRDRDDGGSPLALLDVRMPGLDGPLVLAALQSIDPGVRVYFMTGDPAPYTAAELLALGARRVFAKPLDFTAVAADLRHRPEPARVPAAV